MLVALFQVLVQAILSILRDQIAAPTIAAAAAPLPPGLRARWIQRVRAGASRSPGT